MTNTLAPQRVEVKDGVTVEITETYGAMIYHCQRLQSGFDLEDAIIVAKAILAFAESATVAPVAVAEYVEEFESEETDEDDEDVDRYADDYDEEDTRPIGRVARERYARSRHDEYGIWY